MKGYPLTASTWDHEERAAIERVLDSGRTTMGPEVQAFEAEFAQWLGSPYCLMVNSGSSANLLAVAAPFFRKEQPLKRGDVVVVPAVSWATTYTPLQQYGLKLRFVDIDAKTLNYDLDSLERALRDDVRGLVLVNLLGNPNCYRKIQELIRGREIFVIEDNCESLGAKADGFPAGSFGHVGTFSLFFSHHISSMEGGLVVTDDEELYHIMLSLRAHGWTRNLPDKNKVWHEKHKDPFYESFHFVLPGYNLRPLELSGAIARAQLDKLPQLLDHRKANARRFQERFSNFKWLHIQQEYGSSSWFGFAMTLIPDAPLSRDELIQKLKALNVECRPVVAGNFTRNPVIRWFDAEVEGKLVNADRVHDHGFFVGNHGYPILDQIDSLAELFATL